MDGEARRNPAVHVPPAVEPGLGLGPLALRVVAVCGVVAAVGVVLAVVVPLLGLRSTDCGALNCGLVQTIGKVATSLGVGIGLGAVALSALRAGKITAGILALLIAGPTLLWSVLIVEQWRQLEAGTGEVSQMVAAGREYAAAQSGRPEEALHAIVTNGRGGWAVVRVTGVVPSEPRYVLIERQGGVWRGRAIGTDFDREALRGLGAPTDLMRDAR